MSVFSNYKVFMCECSMPEHHLLFQHDAEDEITEVYAHIHLNHYLPWYTRVWAALKYVFGINTNGVYDTVLMQKQTITELRDYLDGILKGRS